MELTPREVTLPRRRRPRGAAALAMVVLAAAAFVVYQGLSDASLYFRNADAAVAQRDELGTRRFRLHGSVVDGTVVDGGEGVSFDVTYGAATVPVRHVGDPPELFQPGIPVVLEGQWSAEGDWFDSDRILVKHTSEYRADHGDRVDDDR